MGILFQIMSEASQWSADNKHNNDTLKINGTLSNKVNHASNSNKNTIMNRETNNLSQNRTQNHQKMDVNQNTIHKSQFPPSNPPQKLRKSSPFKSAFSKVQKILNPLSPLLSSSKSPKSFQTKANTVQTQKMYYANNKSSHPESSHPE